MTPITYTFPGLTMTQQLALSAALAKEGFSAPLPSGTATSHNVTITYSLAPDTGGNTSTLTITVAKIGFPESLDVDGVEAEIRTFIEGVIA